MARAITPTEKRRMRNPILQFFRFLALNLKIIRVVAFGHGGTRK